ncbi:baseplate J/gp47 family protein [Cellulomonas sp. JH27-2]|uniref:baseplate J/gp47 family protein n=1 Tax=Cellulomonas sp. JH27-2 TaxID=2774139 RepID=UPI00178027E1|nr:baseplate J/gp47 family protein [Cellulomonas sp. JH27-2]MBD8059993.1 baseplate J/gp47 family protein [Cellulomonas sp. JH27-2]
MAQTQYGVTDDGYVVKGLDVVLAEALARARVAFGPDVDLTTTSPLRKILEVAAAEDAELWKRLEASYYAGFVSTADGASLDLLGEDIGVDRRALHASGEVTITLGSGVPGRTYLVNEATVLTTATGTLFTTTRPVTLTSLAPVATVPVLALDPGPLGDVAPATITAIEPEHAAVYFADLGPATLTVTNAAPTSGGNAPEPDDVYRGRLVGTARTLWTIEAVQQAVLAVDGVVDVLISDPLGGVDVSQSYFGLFDFGRRLFAAERRFGEPYLFDVVVAHEFRWPWLPAGSVRGVLERVTAALDLVRPPGVHPNVIEADHIDVGVRARLVVQPGYDQDALLARVLQRVGAEAAALRLGGDVLFAQVMRAFTDEAGVLDVQAMHLRRGPGVFGRFSLGPVGYQSVAYEAGVGENLVMGPTELAVFRPDSGLVDLEVVIP